MSAKSNSNEVAVASGSHAGAKGSAASPSTSAPSNATSQKCGSCGSTAIDVDPSRAEAVCTNCGDVLESNLIVSDIQFEENAHGGSSAIGQFVSSDSKGGAGTVGGSGLSSGFGRMRGGPGGYGGLSGVSRESREITLRNARNKIKALGQQLALRQDRIDIAFNFFKMALSRNLTRGRKSTHVIAACVYITCRTEGTAHMLIDFSDILQIDVYELGRTYLRLSQELCINIPAMDPCLYVMRFAHKLEFGERTHEVSMTALRLVQRMKKDWIHFGRRPSGLCGAALLIAGRLHSFHRTVTDIIKVVKVHESTLRKRLNEFGETPASQLTLDEFMNVDLDAMTEEQDPPSFKAARKKDKERLALLEHELDLEEEVSELEAEIERELAERRAKLRGPYAKMARETLDISKGIVPLDSVPSPQSSESSSAEDQDASKFITEQTLNTIKEVVTGSNSDRDAELMPPPPASPRKGVVVTPGLGLKDTIQEYLTPSPTAGESSVKKKEETTDDDEVSEELDLTGIDDDEIDGYIMSANEIKFKTEMWMKVNAEYLKEKAEKEERERKEEEEALKEGREVKKKKPRGASKKQKANIGGNQTALEAIEKIVQEKKISTKINYDVLKSLNMLSSPSPASGFDEEEGTKPKIEKRTRTDSEASDASSVVSTASEPKKRIKREKSTTKTVDKEGHLHPLATSEPIVETGPVETAPDDALEHEDEDLEEDETCLSAAQLLSQHRGEADEQGFYEEEFY